MIEKDRDCRQTIVSEWVKDTFGTHDDLKERARRLVEEAVEVAQVEGVLLFDLAAIITHVYSKPPGEAHQEVGGVSTTLLAYCEAKGLSASMCELVEIERVLGLPKEDFRARQAEKVAAGVGAPVR